MPTDETLLAELLEQEERLQLSLYDNDDAFRSLSRMFEEREGLNYVKTDPRFDSLHADPRWQVLLRRMNFPPDAN